MAKRQFSRNPEILDATGFSGDGSLLHFGSLFFDGRTDTPQDPPAGKGLMWLDSTNAQLCIKITNSSGVTTKYTLAPMTGVTKDGSQVQVRVLSDGKLDIEQTALYDAIMQLVKELKKSNLYNSLAHDVVINDADIEV